MLINALDYATLQFALDDASDGDRVYIPGGVPWVAPISGFYIRKSLEIFGDGPGSAAGEHGTTIINGSGDVNDAVFVIQPQVEGIDSVYIHGIKIQQPANQEHGGGLRVHFPYSLATSPGSTLRRLRLERMVVNSTKLSSYAIECDESDRILSVALLGCFGTKSLQRAITLKSVRLGRLRGCYVGANAGGGMRFVASAVAAYGCQCENDGDDQPGLPSMTYWESCPIAHLEATDLEHSATYCVLPHAPLNCARPRSTGAEFINCSGAVFVGSNACLAPFMPGPYLIGEPVPPPPQPPTGWSGAPGTSIGLKFATSGSGVSRGVVIGPNLFVRIYSTDGMLSVASEVSGAVVLPQCNLLGGLPDDATLYGQINMPTSTQALPVPPGGSAIVNNGACAFPFVVRPELPSGHASTAGLTVPSGVGDPGSTVTDGMVFLNSQSGKLRVRIFGVWKSISCEMP